MRVATWRLWGGWRRGAAARWWRGGEWVGGSGRSGEEEHNWSWPEDSPENFSCGRKWWPAAVADGGAAAGRIIWERGRELNMSGLYRTTVPLPRGVSKQTIRSYSGWGGTDGLKASSGHIVRIVDIWT
ncbi:hypothetical protein Tco_1275490 [Tanacetum coccineum]